MKLPKLPQINPREARLVIITLILSFAMLNYLLVRPWYNNLKMQDVVLNQKRQDIALKKSAIDMTKDWEKELAKHSPDSGKISLPNLANGEAWTKYLYSLAEKSGFVIPILPKIADGKAKTDPSIVACAFKSPMKGAVNFLSLLLSDPSHPQIKTCTIKSFGAKNDDLLSVDITMSVLIKSNPGKPQKKT